MDPAPLLIILGVAALLPCVQALRCQRGTIETVQDVLELPFSWTGGQKTCEVSEGCQDTLMIIENGPKLNLVLIKGCTMAEDQEPRVTRHRAGPGLSIISYTHVCRHADFCNDLSTTEALGVLPTPSVPGNLRCPVCFAKGDCPKNASEQICPAGHTHCYDGVLKLRGKGITTNLRVQGCMPQPGCNLLNGTQNIGAMDVSESCGPKLGVRALECQWGALETVRNVSELPLTVTSAWIHCEVGEGCQETVMLIHNGPKVNLVFTKGCTMAEDQEPTVSQLRAGPGLFITSYTRVCRHEDLCNDLSTTRSLWVPPTNTVPGTLRCPICFAKGDCPEDTPEQICPAGQTHCYNGVLKLRGGGIASNLRVQGCMPQPGCNLLDGTQKIGIMDVSENCSPKLGVQALECKSGTIEAIKQASDFPQHWTTGWKSCETGEGCQETVMIIKNGPQVTLILTKGCTMAKDQEARVTQHRAGPGLSIISYTHVCRHRDFCNDLSTTASIWAPTPATVPGNLRCPICFAKGDCPEDTPEQICPAGHTHCYDGVLKLRGGGIASNLRVQGCMPQPGCNLLNGTQKIGIMDVSENCNLKAAEQALECQWGTLETVQNISDLPLQWTAGKKTCEVGEGCQDTLMIMENGPQVYLVLTKGCTTAEDQETSVTEHRVGPGLSIVSYTRVCRIGDFCNGLSSTVPLWAPPPATVPGTLRCPICFAKGDCPEDTPEQICPAGQTHCYDGVLKFRGGGIASNLRVQGCMPQPGCNLLNGTQKIGIMDVSENCNLKADAVSCYQGILLLSGSSLAQDPIEWTAHGQQTCDAGEVCQETLLLIDVGYKSLIVGSKGCSRVGQKNSQAVSIHSRPPGMLVASYTRFCSSDFCNSASSSSVLLTSLPRPAAPAPGDMQCLACVQFSGSCFQSSRLVTCPKGTTHCYNGDISLNGGGFSDTLSIQGCMTQASRSLLNNAQTLGIFSVKETFEQKKTENVLPNSDAPGPSLAWAVGLGLPVALWCGGLCPP